MIGVRVEFEWLPGWDPTWSREKVERAAESLAEHFRNGAVFDILGNRLKVENVEIRQVSKDDELRLRIVMSG